MTARLGALDESGQPRATRVREPRGAPRGQERVEEVEEFAVSPQKAAEAQARAQEGFNTAAVAGKGVDL